VTADARFEDGLGACQDSCRKMAVVAKG
jgi:hypothetical protein